MRRRTLAHLPACSRSERSWRSRRSFDERREAQRHFSKLAATESARPRRARARSTASTHISPRSARTPRTGPRGRRRASRGDVRLDRQQGRGRRPQGGRAKWELYGPTRTRWSRASSPSRARRTRPRAASPRSPSRPTAARRSADLSVGVSGGGVWRTDNAPGEGPGLAAGQAADKLDQNSVGSLTLDPTDKKQRHDLPRHRRGEPLLVRLRGRRRHLQVDERRQGLDEARRACVSNATYPCTNPGQDAFLGRGISAIVDRPERTRTTSSSGRRRPFAGSRT